VSSVVAACGRWQYAVSRGPSGLWAVSATPLALEVAPFGIKVCTLEPEKYSTNWARRAGPACAGFLLPLRALGWFDAQDVESLESGSEGDPRKIADVVSATGK